MPANFAEYGRLWAELNPNATVVDWTEEMLNDNEWVNQGVLDDLKWRSQQYGADRVAYYTQVADVLDYELIYKFGGWYFNTDLKPLRPLDTLEYSESLPALAYEDDVHLVNMAMYAPAGNELFRKIIENLPVRYFAMPGGFMNATTGVQLIMQTLSGYHGPVTKFHRDVFNPIHFTDFAPGTEPDLDRDYPESTVAVHLWGHRTNQRAQTVI